MPRDYDAYELDYRQSVAQARAAERAAFIRRTYAHLAGAVLALIGVTALILQLLPDMVKEVFSSRLSALVVFVLFIVSGFVARIWAQSQSSRALQYAGLGLYVVAWAVMLAPLLLVANRIDQNVIPQAGIMTAALFGGLTLAVFLTGKDFSFLGPILGIATLLALGVIIAAIFVGFTLGLLFSFLMVALVSGYILYDTSNVMLHYGTDQHVAAALELLADVALLFWYIVNIFLSSRLR